MKFSRGLIFTFVFFVTLAGAAAAQVENVPGEIRKFAAREEKRAGKPVEINKLIYGDVNGDKARDAIIQYNVQIGYPGNNFISYIAVFLRKGGKYVFTARMENGAKLSTVLVPQTVKNRIIVFDKYGENGFEKTGTANYKLTGKKLVKVK